ncbi:MAG TPA: protein kinase, partial [Polyangiaceae bacterium]|nr:protein kinase [Polyangiaceae bacterium]
RWTIIDFGVARMAGESTLTFDAIVGTPSYMAPEQAKGSVVTHRTDLFALGVIAYRALTGQPAFEDEGAVQTLYRIVNEMPLQPSEIAPLPPALDAVFAVALAKDPRDRFASAADMVRAFEEACAGRADPALRTHAEKLLADLPWRSA